MASHANHIHTHTLRVLRLHVACVLLAVDAVYTTDTEDFHVPHVRGLRGCVDEHTYKHTHTRARGHTKNVCSHTGLERI